MPDKYVEYGDMWKQLNPGYELHDWTEEEIWDTNWTNQRVLDTMREESKRPGADLIAYYTHVADVVDYEIMFREGGFYANTDLKPLKPLSLLKIDNDVPHFAYEDDVHPVNMFMYSPPENLLFRNIIDLLPVRYFGMPKMGMHITTGVGLIEHALREYSGNAGFWHRDVFNPIHWSSIASGTTPDLNREYPENTIAVHSWSHKEYQRGAEILPL